MRKPSFLIPALAGLVLTLLCGCQTIRNGGAPETSFNIDKDLATLATHFSEGDSIDKFYAVATNSASSPQAIVNARNEFIAGRLVMMNIRYVQFVRKTTSEKQFLDTACDILALSLNLAGTSVGSAQAKTILAAIAAGVTGSKVVVDKNFYYEKTIPALMAAMNAQRKQALIPIIQGVATTNIAEYPFEQAISDLQSYYFAGTFLGAIQAIQTDAGVKETAAQNTVSNILHETKLNLRDIQNTTNLTWLVEHSTFPSVTNTLGKLAARPPWKLSDTNLVALTTNVLAGNLKFDSASREFVAATNALTIESARKALLDWVEEATDERDPVAPTIREKTAILKKLFNQYLKQ